MIEHKERWNYGIFQNKQDYADYLLWKKQEKENKK